MSRLTLFMVLTLIGAPCLLFAQNQPGLSPNLLPELKKIGQLISEGKPQEEVKVAWKNVLIGSKDIPVQTAIDYILTEAKSDAKKKADAARDRVKTDSLLTSRIGEELKTVRAANASLRGANAPKPLKRMTFRANPRMPGTIIVRESGTVSTKPEFDNYIKELEEKLSTIGDDAQLANIDLQSKLQQQQQTIQMLSNISKMLHDTAMAIIRKIG